MSSTDNNNNDNQQSEKKKPKKPKGPLRLEAIIPIVIVLALVFGYVSLFFDNHLRAGLEWTGTYVHGAEVNIADIDTSVFNATFTLRGLQVTDKDRPKRNLVQIGRIHLQLLWDALLRAKLVVEDAAIENIQVQAPRKRPGRVLSSKEKKSTALGKLENNVLETTQDQYNDNVLGDVASVAGGVKADDQLKNIQADLESDARIKELQQALKEKEQAWKERIDQLPQKDEIENLGKRAEKLKFDTNNPVQFAKDLKELEKIVKEADQTVKAYESASKTLSGDVNQFDQQIKQLDELVKKDIADLQKRLRIPELDTASFSKALFARMFAERLAGLQKYMELGREYMPPKKSAEEKKPELIPRARGEGENFTYPITTGYPLFWLKKAKISSRESDSEFSGNISGEITDVTSNPVALGRPTIVKVKGDFPKQRIMGLDALITVDHTTSEPEERIEAVIASFPVENLELSDSKDVQLTLKEAKGSANLSARMQNNQMSALLVNEFSETQYDIQAESDTVQQILEAVIGGLPTINVRSRASGNWQSPKLSIRSNLGDELSRGFKAHVEKEIAKAQAELKQFVNQQIEGEKQKLLGEFQSAKGLIDKEVKQGKLQLDQAKRQAENELKSKQNKATKSTTKKLEKEGKKLLKKLGF